MKHYLTCCLAALLLSFLTASAQSTDSKPSRAGSFDIKVRLLEKGNNEPLPFANVILDPTKMYATTDMEGNALLKDVPAGKYTLSITYVGYEEMKKEINVSENLDLLIHMVPSSLALKDVVVTAKQNAAGESTSSIIGRQAIDHLQAMSLDDVMQLIPGHLMKNTDLTSKSNVQIRSLVNNNTNAFGSSVVMDGVPMSNNGNLSQDGFSSSAFVGTDLRQISADDIESVEVIRGIPSAEYGDLTSGVVVVHSKVGQTPWQIKGKVNPGTMNFSLGKGLRIGKDAGILNFNLDYAQAWGDPRMKTKSFDRYTFSAGYSFDISSIWNTTTRVRYVMGKDWNGNDPDAIDDGTQQKNTNQMVLVTHNGKINFARKFSRTFQYTLGFNYTQNEMRKTAIVPNSTGLLPILTATETGYYVVPFETTSYKASGGSVSRPGNLYLKLSNSFFFRSGKTFQNFKMGLDYRYDWNNARGYYNDDERLPLSPNSNGRPRPFYDIPGIHTIAAYVEDNFRLNFTDEQVLRLQLGVRFTGFQPWEKERAFSVSPRINMSLSVLRWLSIRGGFGLNSKTPGLDYIYPAKSYIDRVAASYMPPNDKEAQYLMYYTNVYDVQRTIGLKNATNRKWEAGLDFNLPGERKLSIIGYHDKTANGFGPATEYFVYNANYYSANQGLIITPGQPTKVDFDNPERTDVLFSTKGKIGNTNVAINKGIEMDFNLGMIPGINTSFYLTGAYQETKTYSTDLNYKNPVSLPAKYQQTGTIPFKLLYPSGLNNDVYRQFSNNLRVVTTIPALRMVVSFAAQAIWYNYSKSNNPPMDPIGWLGTDLVYHEITPEMLADENYMINGDVPLKDQRKNPTDNVPVRSPITWLLSGRLTKEFGSVGGLSFYANNLLYYEPFMTSSTSSTLVQRNTGNFTFGGELILNL